MNLQKNLFKGLFIILFIAGFSSPSFAQIEDVGSILQASKSDANSLVEAYLKPFGTGFGAGLNTGWTNTAKPHQTLGFDITVGAGLAIVPDNDLTFNVSELGLEQLELESGSPETPTINGADEPGPTMAAYADIPNRGREKLFDFEMPQGTGFQYVPAPMFKAGVGIIKNTEIMLRYTPEYDIPEVGGTFKLFGVGVKHDIKQWLPGAKLLPVDLSVMFGYTSMDLSSDFEVLPEDVIQEPNDTEIPDRYSAATWQGQGIEVTTNGWTINALVGKTLPILSVYGGIGYEASTMSISTPGTYPTVIPNENYDPNDSNSEPMILDDVPEPIDIEFEGENGFRALAGARFRFAIFHISASYTLANYSSYNLGFGISFR